MAVHEIALTVATSSGCCAGGLWLYRHSLREWVRRWAVAIVAIHLVVLMSAAVSAKSAIARANIERDLIVTERIDGERPPGAWPLVERNWRGDVITAHWMKSE